MKLILPIAGVGQRLRPFTFSKPKGFVTIAGSRGVDHILTKIGSNLPPSTPLCLITGYKSQQIEKYLDTNYTDKFSIDYIEQIPVGYQADIPYFSGLGHAILLTKEWFEKTEDVAMAGLQPNDTLIFLSDMIPVRDYQFILEYLTHPEYDGVIGSMIVPADKTQFYGILETDENQIIVDMVEKPKHTTSNQAISGVYAFKAKTAARLFAILEEQYKIHEIEIANGTKKRREFQFTPALQQLVEEGFKLLSAPFVDGILDFGRPEALLNGNRVLLEAHQSTINGQIAKIENSMVINPCAIGKNTEIVRSVIGKYASIGKNCIIEDCNLNNVVIGDNCFLKKIITQNSIIGDNVKIDSIIKNKITLGDNSFLLEL
ncbi:MAG: sugar phosphate nucleotidyltransferase [Promethearchaeota archaeon]